MSFGDTPITIGGLSVPRFMAAPLDGVTDSPLRQLIREFSKNELLFTEMRHVACVKHDKHGRTVAFEKVEHPLAFQFSANSLENIEEATEKVLEKNIAMINLNVGCPARNVVKSGSGSALMAHPKQLEAIIKEFIRAINGRVPFTIKIRSGFKEKNAVEIAQRAQGAGVDGVIIHPRTQPQGFSGLPDIELTRQVKKAISVPLIFSGNINTFTRAQKVHEQTGVNGFMIGRALWGCPWKMREIVDASCGKTFSVDHSMWIPYALRHLNLNLDHYGPRGFHSFKKQLPVYIRFVPQAASLRKTLLALQTVDELKVHLQGLAKHDEAKPLTPHTA